jgi:hypothetical protein
LAEAVVEADSADSVAEVLAVVEPAAAGNSALLPCAKSTE